jgi:hypothetical protein
MLLSRMPEIPFHLSALSRHRAINTHLAIPALILLITKEFKWRFAKEAGAIITAQTVPSILMKNTPKAPVSDLK